MSPNTNTLPQVKVMIKIKFVLHYDDKRMGILKLMGTAAKGIWTAEAALKSITPCIICL